MASKKTGLIREFTADRPAAYLSAVNSQGHSKTSPASLLQNPGVDVGKYLTIKSLVVSVHSFLGDFADAPGSPQLFQASILVVRGSVINRAYPV